VKVAFTTASGTTQTRFSLVSYTSSTPTFDAATADQSRVFEYVTGLFEPGRHILVIQVPSCYFQVDFVKGCVIDKMGPENTNNFYSKQNRSIATDNGGVNACQALGVSVNIDNQFQSGEPDTTVTHYVGFQNTSNTVKDHINISIISSHGWKVELFNNTTLMATDDNGDGTWEYVNSSYDFDANGQPETKLLNMDEQANLDVVVSIPSSALVGDMDTLQVFGFSAIDANVFDMTLSFTEINQPTILPITLLSFTAALNGKSVRLDWITAQEINNDFFTIERSANGTDFTEIIVQRGAGNTNAITTYSTNDNEPLTGRAYYRLKQTDFNGENTTSATVVVYSANITKTISLQQDVYPNPFTENFTIAFNVEEHGTVVTTLRDIQGKVISNNTINVTKGANQFSFADGSSLPKGMYFVSLEYKGQLITSKIAKTDF
jgi:hypothetical protein